MVDSSRMTLRLEVVQIRAGILFRLLSGAQRPRGRISRILLGVVLSKPEPAPPQQAEAPAAGRAGRF
jgi:hypothetical protein